MKLKVFALLLAFILAAGCQEKQKVHYQIKDLPKPESETDQVSYILGYNLGERMRMDSVDVNMEYYIEGFLLAYNAKENLMEPDKMDSVMRAFSDKMMAKQQQQEQREMERYDTIASEMPEKSKEFLKENKKKEGVKVLDNGLQYEVLKEGTGKKPSPGEMVEVHFVGKLPDGTVFDDTRQGQPPVLPVDDPGVLKGWTEAWKRMKVGSKWRIVIPPELGLGEKGAPPKIPPNTALIFEMELLGIEEEPPPPPEGQFQQ
mgnify:CR=1 FL=1